VTEKPSRNLDLYALHALAAASGFAALSWETLWQIRAGLALGVSAWGAALTLAVTMGGMGIGALAAGRWLREGAYATSPFRLYGILEAVIGLCGLALPFGFLLAGNFDTWFYSLSPAAAPIVYVVSIAAVLGIPALCMGATLPVMGLMARYSGAGLPMLYGFNTLGAAAGVLLAAFAVIPALGLAHTGFLAAGLNFAATLGAWMLGARPLMRPQTAEKVQRDKDGPSREAMALAAATGFATLALEVAWFRVLTAAFTNTTAAFAVMLASVLLALGAAAVLVPVLKARGWAPGPFAAAGGVAVLLATPLLERFDRVESLYVGAPLALNLNRLLITLYVLGPPVLLLGLALPWLLGEQRNPRGWGRLYALNTLAAIAGALLAAWLLLPVAGFAKTAWLAGIAAAAAGLYTSPQRLRPALGACAAAALIAAVAFDSHAGVLRVPGHPGHWRLEPSKILAYAEGPEAAVSAVEYANGGRSLVIDGFVTASQWDPHGKASDRYMTWMGALPMLANPDPKQALVICFGTGQTANAVRRENPAALDIVDINSRVLALAPYFDTNESVLSDPRVTPIVMDGRAWLRRTDKHYDVITLEPMPPNFAGVNALYSLEFYRLASSRLSAHGVIAQWLPFHLLASHYMASIAATFQAVFPNALLWLDPVSMTGVLLGSNDDTLDLPAWPGFARNKIPRDASEETVRAAAFLGRTGVARYAAEGEIITDDNQLLAYGDAVAVPRTSMMRNTYQALKTVQVMIESPESLRAQEKLKLWPNWP
jgi:spermidine synthase